MIDSLSSDCSNYGGCDSFIYDARMEAGLTQEELALLVGTKQPNIARLEDAEYEGNSLSMLQNIADVLDQRIEITLQPRQVDSLTGKLAQ